MKYAFYGILIIASFFLGKGLYGTLAPILLGTSEGAAEVGMVTEVTVQSEQGSMKETVDLAKLVPEDFPEKISLESALILTNVNGLDPLPLEAGSMVTPLTLSGTILTVTSPPATHLSGEISVFETSFVQSVAETRVNRRLAMNNSSSEDAKPAEPTSAEQKSDEDPQEAVVEAEPEPEVAAPEPEAAKPVRRSKEELVAAMKASLDSGTIKELSADTIQTWEIIDDESFDGEDFRVGLVTYKELTILGEKTLQAKALFKGGELQKWIHAKTGMLIR